MTSPKKQTVAIPGRLPTDFAMECSSVSGGGAEAQAAGGKGPDGGLGQGDPWAVGQFVKAPVAEDGWTTPRKKYRERSSRRSPERTRPQTSKPTATRKLQVSPATKRKNVKFKSTTPSSEDSAVGDDIRVGPLVCIEKYEERTDQYGVGYVLSNNHVGILFNDRTSMITKDSRSEVVLVDGKKSGL